MIAFLDNQHIWSLIANLCRKPIEGSIAIGAETAQKHVKNYIKRATVFFEQLEFRVTKDARERRERLEFCVSGKIKDI